MAANRLPVTPGFGKAARMTDGIWIDEVNPHDDAMLRAFWECEQASMRADREHALLRNWKRLQTMTRTPNEWYARTLLVALDGETVVGGADLGRSLRDNTHLAQLEINVQPDRRRQGIGRLLHDEAIRRAAADGRNTVCGEVFVPSGGDEAGVPAYEFATSLGFASVHREDHLVLRLPVSSQSIAALRARVGASGYDALTWTGACPAERLDDLCQMHTRMENDVPIGDINYEPVVVDEERLRAQEGRLLLSFDLVTAVARRTADGVFGGYSQLLLPHGDHYVYQADTLVMPDHRGHRLGTLLKVSTLAIVQGDHPERVAIHTDTAVGNDAMQATNRSFGFRPVERMHEMQRKYA